MAAENTSNAATPNTIVLIHGLWMTPLSWEHWIECHEARGFRVLAPAWPGMDGDIHELRRDPTQAPPRSTSPTPGVISSPRRSRCTSSSPPLAFHAGRGGLGAGGRLRPQLAHRERCGVPGTEVDNDKIVHRVYEDLLRYGEVNPDPLQ